MYNPNVNIQITPSADYNYKKPTNQNSVKSTKLLSQRTRKRYCKTLGTKNQLFEEMTYGRTDGHVKKR